jgi:hypothetical protein
VAAGIEFTLPDNLTRYRVMVVAVRGEQQFGSGEGALTARKPLMVRPSAPRFLNFGDTFELPILVQNQTDASMVVDVVVRAHNLGLDGQDAVTPAAGRRVTVPANDRVEVRLPAAARRVGTARAQVLVVSGGANDAATVELPVYTPATTEAFATYGVLDEGAIRQPVKAPSGVWKEVGGLEVTTASTALQSLTDAVLYLTSYPFECSEQTQLARAGRDITARRADRVPGRRSAFARSARCSHGARHHSAWNRCRIWMAVGRSGKRARNLCPSTRSALPTHCSRRARRITPWRTPPCRPGTRSSAQHRGLLPVVVQRDHA